MIMLKAFDETKAGVKVPVIDLSKIYKAERRKQNVEQVRIASETWGVLSGGESGIALNVFDEMLDGVGPP
ncbi:hypothetical protein ACS0TY_032617 [Phlomoides rotata]